MPPGAGHLFGTDDEALPGDRLGLAELALFNQGPREPRQSRGDLRRVAGKAPARAGERLLTELFGLGESAQLAQDRFENDAACLDMGGSASNKLLRSSNACRAGSSASA